MKNVRVSVPLFHSLPLAVCLTFTAAGFFLFSPALPSGLACHLPLHKRLSICTARNIGCASKDSTRNKSRDIKTYGETRVQAMKHCLEQSVKDRFVHTMLDLISILRPANVHRPVWSSYTSPITNFKLFLSTVQY